MLTPTAEQSAAMTAFATGDHMVIEAGAGTGKTSTVRLMADTRPNARGIYLAFNTVTAKDAARSFPRSVDCRTAHSFAYRWTAQQWGSTTLQARLNATRQYGAMVTKHLGITRALFLQENRVVQPSTLARIAQDTVGRFCNSADPALSRRHVPIVEGVDTQADRDALAETIRPLAQKAWLDMSSPRGRLRMTHDVYLKLWALSEPTLDADYVLLDEAQDSAPVIAGVFAQQPTQRVAVGDTQQSIYAWRGAIDAMADMDAPHRLFLTQSWRFGPAIAEEANKWLEVLNAQLRITGTERIPSTVGPVDAPDAILCRSNAKAVEKLMTLHEKGIKAGIVGGANDVKYLAEAARDLKHTGRTSHRELQLFTSWQMVLDYVDQDHGGSDFKVAVNLIERHGAEAIVAAIDASAPENRADVVLSTAHKAKGREWSRVQIADDFPEPKTDEDAVTMPGQPKPTKMPADEELRLAYVAVTRAKLHLDRGCLSWIDRHL